MSFFCLSTTCFSIIDILHHPALLDLLQSLCTVNSSYQSDSSKLILASLLDLRKSYAKSWPQIHQQQQLQDQMFDRSPKDRHVFRIKVPPCIRELAHISLGTHVLGVVSSGGSVRSSRAR
jgi:hypothetical protein